MDDTEREPGKQAEDKQGAVVREADRVGGVADEVPDEGEHWGERRHTTGRIL